MYRPNWKETLLFFWHAYSTCSNKFCLHHRPPCLLNNEYWLSVYQITTKNIYCRRKCQNMQKNMRYAHFAKICEKCGKAPNMWQSHICVFLTCLTVTGSDQFGWFNSLWHLCGELCGVLVQNLWGVVRSELSMAAVDSKASSNATQSAANMQ